MRRSGVAWVGCLCAAWSCTFDLSKPRPAGLEASLRTELEPSRRDGGRDAPRDLGHDTARDTWPPDAPKPPDQAPAPDQRPSCATWSEWTCTDGYPAVATCKGWTISCIGSGCTCEKPAGSLWCIVLGLASCTKAESAFTGCCHP